MSLNGVETSEESSCAERYLFEPNRIEEGSCNVTGDEEV